MPTWYYITTQHTLIKHGEIQFPPDSSDSYKTGIQSNCSADRLSRPYSNLETLLSMDSATFSYIGS